MKHSAASREPAQNNRFMGAAWALRLANGGSFHSRAGGRGRDVSCLTPPAQIPEGAANALGSYLGS
jgi:hypothetical protein